MPQGLAGWMRGIVEEFQRHALLKRLERLDDHLLDDIGLRRDQLDTVILHAEKERIRTAGFRRRRPVVRPHLQGCG